MKPQTSLAYNTAYCAFNILQRKQSTFFGFTKNSCKVMTNYTKYERFFDERYCDVSLRCAFGKGSLCRFYLLDYL